MAFAFLVAALTSCGSQIDGEPIAVAGSGSAAESGSYGDSYSDDSYDSDEPDPEDLVTTVKFGGNYIFSDGMEVRAEAPEPYTPTEVAAGGIEGQDTFSAKVTLINGSSETYDKYSFYAFVISGGVPGDRIFDSPSESRPSSDLQPGEKSVFLIFFSAADSADIQVQIHRESIDVEGARFTT